jgi:uncharacterized protein (TIGR00369 family)
MNETRAKKAFEKAMENYAQEFDKFFLARFYGLDIHYNENVCHIELDVEDYMLNPQGTLHGGIITFAMDVSMGHLLNYVYGPGVTLEIKVQFVKAVKSGRVSIKAEFIKRGKNICFLRSEVCDSEENLIAYATSTWKLL